MDGVSTQLIQNGDTVLIFNQCPNTPTEKVDAQDAQVVKDSDSDGSQMILFTGPWTPSGEAVDSPTGCSADPDRTSPAPSVS